MTNDAKCSATRTYCLECGGSEPPFGGCWKGRQLNDQRGAAATRAESSSRVTGDDRDSAARPAQSAPLQSPAAWRYRYNGTGVSVWKYVDREEECNSGAEYVREPLYLSPAEQELPASSVSAASVSPSKGGLGSEASDVQQPARSGGPSAVERIGKELFGTLWADATAEDWATTCDHLRAENERLRDDLSKEHIAGVAQFERAERAEAALRGGVVSEELTFSRFRAANVTRCVKWHPAGINSWSTSDWLTAVTGELGELASLLKMRNRERDGLPGNKFSHTDKQVADELADVLTYLDLLAAALGVDLGRAAVEKFNEVSERVGFPDRIELAAAKELRGDVVVPEEVIRFLCGEEQLNGRWFGDTHQDGKKIAPFWWRTLYLYPALAAAKEQRNG